MKEIRKEKNFERCAIIELSIGDATPVSCPFLKMRHLKKKSLDKKKKRSLEKRKRERICRCSISRNGRSTEAKSVHAHPRKEWQTKEG